MTYAVYLMVACGLTVTMIDVEGGPGAWVVRMALRPLMSRLIGMKDATELLACGVCFSAYTGAAVGGVVAAVTGDLFPLCTLPLAAPFVFWLCVRVSTSRWGS